MTAYDLLLKGGEVIDPSQSLRGRYDVAVLRGRIAAVSEHIDPSAARLVVDVSGKIVTPGLVDLHAHVYAEGTALGVVADEVCPPAGVTTVLDAGSAGCNNFAAFRRLAVNSQRTRVYALVHISRIGLTGFPVPEMRDISFANVEGAARTVLENQDVCLGIKVRQSAGVVGDNYLRPLELAVEAATLAQCPVMVHIGGAPAPLSEIIRRLRPGDIITHCFAGTGNGVVDEDGRFLDVCWEARQRGIYFDVGHGQGSLNFNVCRAALEAGFLPDAISSDVHVFAINSPMQDMPTVMSKFLNLGLTLEQVIERTTIAPARIMGREDGLGTLRVGATGDIAVFEMQQGHFEWLDTNRDNNHLIGDKRLVNIYTVTRGQLWGRPLVPPS